MSSIFRWVVILLGVCTVVVALAVESAAQSLEGFMYGKVYTENNTYTGPIRWGNEEVLWTDLFNASKTSDQYQKMVPDKKDDEDNSWFGYDWNFSSIWEDKYTTHQFTCQFGNISEITRVGSSKAKLKFRNGAELTITGEGYNDIGAKIQVADPELGTVSINWEKISKVEFLETPSKLTSVFGMPVYGTVETARKEKFSGYIVWDQDERLTSDKLDGDSEDGDVSLKFLDIASIEKDGSGSEVTLKSGRQLKLHGSNDVNGENRGIAVVTPGLGIVNVTWEAFRKLTISQAEEKIQDYDDFAGPKLLRGTVSRLDGDDVTGQIIFDIDETMDFEMVEGEENDVEYIVPLRHIKKIIPKNEDYASLELRSGKTLLVGSRRDVSSENGGMLVFVKGKKEPQYISWKKINEIIFN